MQIRTLTSLDNTLFEKLDHIGQGDADKEWFPDRVVATKGCFWEGDNLSCLKRTTGDVVGNLLKGGWERVAPTGRLFSAASTACNEYASISAVSIDPAASISADSIDPAARISAGPAEPFPTVIEPVHADDTSLPPGHSVGSSEHSTRFPSPSDLANSISLSSEMEDIYHYPTTGIFSSSSYDADFGGTITNLAPIVAVDPVSTKRVNTIHPQSQVLGDLTLPVQTRGTLKKSKFGESTFVSYVHDQQRNNHTDYVHYLQCKRKMQHLLIKRNEGCKPLPDGKIAIGTNGF
ncbi:hypothetical protein Tco_0345803 [Tanacetum coccineum]